MNFRIRDLRNFFETASCRTMYEASKKLAITQPSLSESIKRLEQDLKLIVFYRSRSGIQLTPSGRILYEKSKSIFATLDEIESNQSLLTNHEHHNLLIGCHHLVSEYVFPKILAEFDKKNSGVRFEIIHDMSHKIQFQVQSGSLDVALIVNPFPSPDLIMKKCLLDEMGVWQSNQLYNPDRIICDINSFHSQAILKKWKKRPKHMLVSNNFALNARLVEQGAGYGILPKKGIQLLGLNLKPVPNAPSTRIEVSLVHKPAFGRHMAERLFIDTIKKVLVNS